MLKKLLSSKKILIVLGIITLLIFIFSLIKPKISTPSLIGSKPTNNSKNVGIVPPLELYFLDPITSKDFTITSSPDNNWTLSAPDPRTLIINHSKPLTQDTKYIVNILWKNKLLADLTFTTMSTQTDYELLDNLKTELDRDYPLADLTPYNTDLFYVVYSAPMILEITIKNENILPEKAFNEIRTWVTSVGGDADAHKYVISDQPLPSTTSPITTTPTKTPSPSPTPFNWDALQDDGT